MTIFEVIKALEEGKKIHYVKWAPGDYIYYDKIRKDIFSSFGERCSESISFHLEGWEIYEDKFIEIPSDDDELVMAKCRHCGRVHTRGMDTTPYIYCPYCGKDSRIPVPKGETI